EMGGVAAIDHDAHALVRQGGSAGLAQAAGRGANDRCQAGDAKVHRRGLLLCQERLLRCRHDREAVPRDRRCIAGSRPMQPVVAILFLAKWERDVGAAVVSIARSLAFGHYDEKNLRRKPHMSQKSQSPKTTRRKLVL